MPSLHDDNAQTLTLRHAKSGVRTGVVKTACGGVSAEVLPFDAPVSRPSAADAAADFVDLAQARSDRNARRTRSGMFVYVPRL